MGHIGFCNASSFSTRGMWLAGVCALDLVIWQVQWPHDIRTSIVSVKNPMGKISNSDLKMAGMLLHYLALKHLVPLQHVHVAAAWCNNTPTMSWTNKLSASGHTSSHHSITWTQCTNVPDIQCIELITAFTKMVCASTYSRGQ